MIERIDHREFVVSLSYLEVYNEKLIDLMNCNSAHELAIVEAPDGDIEIRNLTAKRMTTPDEVYDALLTGEMYRHQGSTAQNERSSRSHTILRIRVESQRCENDDDGSEADEVDTKEEVSGQKRKRKVKETRDSGANAVRVGVLNLVDLAGSEGVSRAQTEGERKREGSTINKSLLALSRVISQLSQMQNDSQSLKRQTQTYINFRDTKLTRILSNSLGGNAQTAMICNCSSH
eukprot:Polyplicarium_translucidae@DN3806_c0_g1_i1.p1